MADSFDQEVSLSDLIYEQMQSSGALDRFKVQITNEIFKIMCTEEKNSIKNEQLELQLKSNIGCLTLHLIKDFLTHIGLHHTVTMFQTEIGGLLKLYQHYPETDIDNAVLKIKEKLSKCNKHKKLNTSTSYKINDTEKSIEDIKNDNINANKALNNQEQTKSLEISSSTFVKSDDDDDDDSNKDDLQCSKSSLSTSSQSNDSNTISNKPCLLEIITNLVKTDETILTSLQSLNLDDSCDGNNDTFIRVMSTSSIISDDKVKND